MALVCYNKNFKNLRRFDLKEELRHFINDGKFDPVSSDPLIRYQRKCEYAVFKLLQSGEIINNIQTRTLRFINSTHYNDNYKFAESFTPYDLTFKTDSGQYFIDVKHGSARECKFNLSEQEVDFIKKLRHSRFYRRQYGTNLIYGVMYVTDFSSDGIRNGKIFTIWKSQLDDDTIFDLIDV